MTHGDAVRPHDILVMALLAVVLALGITTIKSFVALQIALGLIVLLIGFVSTRASLYLLIFSMLLSPEIAVGTAQGAGVGGREISIRFDDILLILIGFSWLVKTIVYRELALFRFTPLNRPIAYYMAVCVVATLLGVITGRVRPATGFFFVLKYFEYFFIFFMVVNNVTTKTQMVRLVLAVLATCFLISVYAITQIPSGQRATAPFEGEAGEPNTLGGYLVLMMAISVGLLLHLEGALIRVAIAGLIGLMLLALMATLSRSSYLAAGVMVLAVAATQLRRPAIIATVLMLMLLAPLLAPANVRERVTDTFFGRKYGGEISIAGVTVDLSTTERLKSWAFVIENWTHRPLLGYGVTGYAWADAQYVKIIGETGLAGIVTFFYLIALLWQRIRTTYQAERDPFCKGLSYGLMLGLIAMLTHAIGANTFIIIRIMEPFWLVAGLVVIIPTLTDKVGSPEPGRSLT